MNEPAVVPGAIAAPAPIGRVAAGGLGRVALAGLVLILAAVVMTTSGGAGLGGRLGALFGLHSKQGGKPVSAIQAAAPAAVHDAVTVARVAPAQPRRTAPHAKRHTRRPPVTTTPQGTPAPAPNPAPALPPSQPPPIETPHPPGPAPEGNVQHAVKTVRDSAAPLAPPLQPVLDQSVAAVDKVCGLVGGCP
jgi:hypothetical protein